MKGLRNLCNNLFWLTQPGWRTVTSVWGSDKNISYMKTTLQLKEKKNFECGFLSIHEVANT